MKKLVPLIAAAFLLTPLLADAAITHGNSAGANASTACTGKGVAVSLAVSSTDLIVISGNNGSTGAVPTIVDSQGNTYFVAVTSSVAGEGKMYTWYAIAQNTGTIRATTTWNTGTTFCNINADNFKGAATTTPLDATSQHTGSATSQTSGTSTVNYDNELIYGMDEDSVTAAGAGFTLGGNDSSGDIAEWRVLVNGSGTQQSAPFTGSGQYNIHMATFMPPQAGGGGGGTTTTAPTAQNQIYTWGDW